LLICLVHQFHRTNPCGFILFADNLLFSLNQNDKLVMVRSFHSSHRHPPPYLKCHIPAPPDASKISATVRGWGNVSACRSHTPTSHGSLDLSDIFSAARGHTGFRTYRNWRPPGQGMLRYKRSPVKNSLELKSGDKSLVPGGFVHS
jgi:hypothetical protein